MKKLILAVVVLCFVITLFAGPYDDMINKTYRTEEIPGRVNLYLETETNEWVFEYNISKELEYVFVSETKRLIKSSNLQREKLDGKLWLNNEGYDVILEGDKLVSRISSKKIFGNEDQIRIIFSWEFWEPDNYFSLIDWSPFANTNPENDGKARYVANIFSNGDVIPRGTE